MLCLHAEVGNMPPAFLRSTLNAFARNTWGGMGALRAKASDGRDCVVSVGDMVCNLLEAASRHENCVVCKTSIKPNHNGPKGQMWDARIAFDI